MSKPELKRVAVMPSIMPRSLKALFIQLNSGWEAIAEKISANPIMGARKPQVPDSLSNNVFEDFFMFSFSRSMIDLGLKV